MLSRHFSRASVLAPRGLVCVPVQRRMLSDAPASNPPGFFPSVPLPIPDSASVVHRAIAIVYGTSDPMEKATRTRDTYRLWREGSISLYSPKDDDALLDKLHSQPASIDAPSPDVAAAVASSDPWERPARPDFPVWVPFKVPTHRKLGVGIGAYTLHALAHVELNAVDMYLDTLARFAVKAPPPPPSETGRGDALGQPELPAPTARALAEDLLSIADDEARHFTLVAKRLEQLSIPPVSPTGDGTGASSLTKAKKPAFAAPKRERSRANKPSRVSESQAASGESQDEGQAATVWDVRYGRLPAVGSLWALGVATRHSLASRLAVVPLSQEARGVDATPRFVERLLSIGDPGSARLVDLIGQEEERHVALGLRWLAATAHCSGAVPLPEGSQPVDKAQQQGFPSETPPVDEARAAPAGEWAKGLPKPPAALDSPYMVALGAYWRSLVAPHFPDGMFPPWNSIGRAAAGMPEHWYLPLASPTVPPAFLPPPLAAPKDSHVWGGYVVAVGEEEANRMRKEHNAVRKSDVGKGVKGSI